MPTDHPSPREPETPTCPQCKGALQRVHYEGGYLNEEQFDSIRAGDWYCTTCPGKRALSGYRYYWNHELSVASGQPGAREPEEPTEVMAPFDAIHSWRLSAGLTDGQDAALLTLLVGLRQWVATAEASRARGIEVVRTLLDENAGLGARLSTAQATVERYQQALERIVAQCSPQAGPITGPLRDIALAALASSLPAPLPATPPETPT